MIIPHRRFDTIGASELSTKVADLTGKLQDGLGRKIGDAIQYATQFVFAFGSALYLRWELTVVLLAAFPVIAAAGTFMIRVSRPVHDIINVPSSIICYISPC
jgi:ATP-binding cassette subfamily B (MDR/TAP) protein 1